MKLSQRAKDRWAVAFGVFWLRFFAPCEYVGWMPVSETPGRCLSVDVR